MTLSVVLPVFNDEKEIPETLRRICAFLSLKDHRWEIIVSDNGSTDSTQKSVSAFSKANPRHAIKLVNAAGGSAAGQGVLGATGRYVLLTEVGLATPIKEVDKLVQALEKGADIAVGSRAVHAKDCDVRQNPLGRVREFFLNSLVRLVLLPHVRDPRCRFKCFKNDVARRLFTRQRADADLSGIEALYRASKEGFRVVEVPVMWSEEFPRRSGLNVFDLFRIRTEG